MPKITVLLVGIEPLAVTPVSQMPVELVFLKAVPQEELDKTLERYSPDLVVYGNGAEASLSQPKHAALPVSSERPSLDYHLTERQRQVLALLAGGLTNNEIGIQLGLSERSAKAVLAELFTRFDVSNRTELLGSIAELGLLESLRSS